MLSTMGRNKYYFYFNEESQKFEIRWGMALGLLSNVCIDNYIANFGQKELQSASLTRGTMWDDHIKKQKEGGNEPSLADRYIKYIESCLDNGSMYMGTCEDCGCKFIVSYEELNKIRNRVEDEGGTFCVPKHCLPCRHKSAVWKDIMDKSMECKKQIIRDAGVLNQKYIVLDYLHKDGLDVNYFSIRTFDDEFLKGHRLDDYQWIVLPASESSLMTILMRYMNRCKIGGTLEMIKCKLCGRYSILTARKEAKLRKKCKSKSYLCLACFREKCLDLGLKRVQYPYNLISTKEAVNHD